MRNLSAVLKSIQERLQCWFSRALKNKFLRNFLVLSSATSVAQLIAIACSPIITRLYTPEDFGVQAIFSTILSQCLILSCLRYEWAIPLPKQKDNAVALTLGCVVLTMMTSSLITCITFLGRHRISSFLKLEHLNEFLYLCLGPTILIASLYQIFNYWNIREENFLLIARTKVFQSLGSTSGQIILGILNFGPYGLIAGTILNSSIGTFRLLQNFLKREKRLIQQVTHQLIKNNLREHVDFPRISVWSSFINSASLNAPTILLSFLYGLDVVGSFSLAQKLINLPVNLLGGSIFQVFLSKFVILVNNDPSRAKRLYVKAFLGLFIISLILGGFFWCFSYFSVKIFGEQWQELGEIIRCLTPTLVTSLTVSSLSLLDWLGKQSWMLVWNFVRIVSIVIVFRVSDVLNFSYTNCVGLFSGLICLMYLLLLFLNFKALPKSDLEISK